MTYKTDCNETGIVIRLAVKVDEIHNHHAPARSGKRYTAWCGKIDTVSKWSENMRLSGLGKQDISYQPPANLSISPSTVINQALRAIKFT